MSVFTGVSARHSTNPRTRPPTELRNAGLQEARVTRATTTTLTAAITRPRGATASAPTPSPASLPIRQTPPKTITLTVAVEGACPVRDPTTSVWLPFAGISGGGEYSGCGVYSKLFQGVCLPLGASDQLIEVAGMESGVGVGEATQCAEAGGLALHTEQ